MALRSRILEQGILLLLLFLVSGGSTAASTAEECNLFVGSWVVDETYPLYTAASCPFVQHEFSCVKNGRPDLGYTKYRWQPLNCDLSRFDGKLFLEKLRGKSILFVGDSLSRNQWQSLTCMLHSAVPNAHYTLTRVGDVSTFTFTEYEVKVMLEKNVYLVDIVREEIGRVLKLDIINEGSSKLWQSVDFLIFNTWHWWNRRGSSQPWDYIEIGKEMLRDMDRMVAFEKALTTWGRWVDLNIDPQTNNVFFQGISPSHYNGSLWGEPRAKSCVGQNEPVAGSVYPGGSPPAVAVLKAVLSKIINPIHLLDVTELSLLRKDGHPSKYGLVGRTGLDCSHWCLAGVPDTWNLLFYNLII
ncbi:protein trichome birefringence-like 41 [Cucurbita moschata]|uniref:Protein trichome birefringence-like 41 n=1 Tax=Cucurbita moschata TaxID=3662 RepID=A0A6J1FRK0_CUCMO|nr:protein trichome birefringence-like 41 [Cucurbita moschata]